MWSRPWRCGGCSFFIKHLGRSLPRTRELGVSTQCRTFVAAHAQANRGEPSRQAEVNALAFVSGGHMPRGGKARKRVAEFFPIERLDQKTIHARLEAGVAILHQRIGRQRKDLGLAAA